MKIKNIFIFSILIIALIFLYPLFFNKFYSFRDTFLYVIPLKSFTMEKIKDGFFPWYNPYNGGGEYFLANPQTNPFYPLSYFFLLPPHLGFQLYQFSQILFCFIGVYLLSKSYGKDEFKALSYAFSVIFSGIFLSLWDLTFEMGCISFLFLALWALKEKKFKFFLLFLSLMFFSGEPFTFFLSFLFIIFFIIIEKIEFKKFIKSIIFFVIFSSGIFFLIFSIIFDTIRTEKTSLVLEGLNYKKLLSLFGGSASFYNSYEYSYLPILFFGTFIFSSFLSGLFSSKKKLYLMPFFFFLFLSMGNFGVLKFLFYFPPFSLLRYPERFLPLCIVPMLLIGMEKCGKKFLVFFIHFFLIILSFLFFPPKSLIFLFPLISFFLLIIISEKSKFLIFIPFLDLILSLPLFTVQKFEIPKLPYEFKKQPLFRIAIPEKNIIYFKYLYPNNYFTKESDLKGILSFESYTNLFYPVLTNYTPHPFPLKIYKEFSKDRDFILSCSLYGIIERDGLKWLKLKSAPLFESEIENLKIKGDGFEFKLNLKKKEKVILRFLNLKYTKVYANGKKIEIEKGEKWIKFNLKPGNYDIKISFTPLILKIFYLLSFLAWISFLCYLIIKWIF